MNVNDIVAKAKLIVDMADEQGLDEYGDAVVEQFGEYLRGYVPLETVNIAFDEWLITLRE